MRILITGAGFIDSHLAGRFLSKRNEVIAADNVSTGRISTPVAAQENLRFLEHDVIQPVPIDSVLH